MKILFKIIVSFFLVTIILFCQVFEREFDFYEHSIKLWEHLNKWQVKAPTLLSSNTEDIAIKNVFANYNYSIDTSSNGVVRLNAKLPIYMNIISTELSYLCSKNLSNNNDYEFATNIRYNDSLLIFDDSITVKIEGNRQLSDSIFNLLAYRFYLYRTLGLPQNFRPEYNEERESVKLFFHAFDIDSLLYKSKKQWLQTMNKLSQNKIVYAGPSSIILNDEKLMINFYVLITTQEASGHHFFLIEEVLKHIDNEFPTINITVDFYPYVRVDNLLSLYRTKSSIMNKEIFQIKINR